MNEVIHLDVRPENILIINPEQENLRFKLADFGLSEPASAPSEKSSDALVSVFRMPEVFIGSNYSFAADIWSLGVCITETILGFDMTFGMKSKGPEKMDKQIVCIQLYKR